MQIGNNAPICILAYRHLGCGFGETDRKKACGLVKRGVVGCYARYAVLRRVRNSIWLLRSGETEKCYAVTHETAPLV